MLVPIATPRAALLGQYLHHLGVSYSDTILKIAMMRNPLAVPSVVVDQQRNRFSSHR